MSSHGRKSQVFFIAQDNSIRRLYRQADGQCGYGNLSAALPTAPPPASPSPTLPPLPLAAYMRYFENTSHVVYLQPPELPWFPL